MPKKTTTGATKKATPQKTLKKTLKKAATSTKKTSEVMPLMAEAAERTTRDRRNVSGIIERTDRFKNIEDGITPFKYSHGSYGSNKSSVDVSDAVKLCQKAYYNFAVFMMSNFQV